MTRSARALWINGLLLTLALLSVGLVLWSSHTPTTLTREARASNLLAEFSQDEVTRLEFERAQGSFTLDRVSEKETTNTNFRISAPFQEEAAPEAVDAILGTLRYAGFDRRIAEAAVDRAAFGLDTPKLVLHVDMGQVHYRLRLGSSPPALSGGSYLEVSGEGAREKGVYVVRQSLVDEIDVGLDKFRGRQLIPYGRASISTLKLTSSTRTWEIRRARERFRFTGTAQNAFMDREREERLFLQLSRLKLERFVPVDVAEAALKQTQPLRLEIKPSSDGPAAWVEFGADCPADPSLVLVVRRAPGVLAGCVSKAISGELTASISDLLDLHLFASRLDEVTGLELTNGTQKLELVRSSDGFELKQPEAGKVEADIAEERLKGFLALRGTLVLDKSPTALGLNEPAITLVFHVSVGGEAGHDETVSLAFADAETTWAWRRADDAVLKLEQVDRSLFDASALLLKSRQVLDFQAREIERIDIDTPDVKQVIVQTEAGPRLESPSGFNLDSSLGFGLLDAVRNLRALRWVAASDTGQFGLGDPQGRIQLAVKHGEGAAAKHELLLGANTKGGVFAKMDGSGVFVLSSGVVEVLKTWALDRAVFLPLLGDVTRIAVRASRGNLELRKSGDSFRQVGGSRELSSAEIQQLLDALGVIRAEATVHLGAAQAHEGFAKPTLELTADAANGERSVKWTIGVADAWRDVSVYYGRVSGQDATFVVPRRHIQQILDAL